MHAADETVLKLIERSVFDPKVVEAAVEAAGHELSQRATPTAGARRENLKVELQRIQKELARCVAAIAKAGSRESLLESIRVCEERRDAIHKEFHLLGAKKAPARSAPGAIRTRVSDFLDERRVVTRRQVSETRRLLRHVLVGRLVFTTVARPRDLPHRKDPGRKTRFVCAVSGEVSRVGVFADLIGGGFLVAPTGRDRTYRIQVRDFIAR